MAIRCTGRTVWLAAATGLAACAGDAPDPVCRTEPAEQAGLRVQAPPDVYFYAHDQAGTQVGYERGGTALALAAGAYNARINGSQHAVTVRDGQVTHCTAATLTVSGTTEEFYYVLDTLAAQLSYARLGQPTALFPGDYVIKVNDTRTRTTLSAETPVTIASATFTVTGTTQEYFYALDTAAVQLAYARLGQPMALLAGNYVARVNGSQASFSTRAGESAQLAAGTVTGTGTTQDYYYVLDTAGEQLAYARLGTPLALLPGTYQFRLTGSTTPLAITAGQATLVASGTLLVNGQGAEYYYVLDAAGGQLGYNRLNTPTPLLPGTYTVRIGDHTESVTITADSTTTLARQAAG